MKRSDLELLVASAVAEAVAPLRDKLATNMKRLGDIAAELKVAAQRATTPPQRRPNPTTMALLNGTGFDADVNELTLKH
jgi:hypothetical protein